MYCFQTNNKTNSFKNFEEKKRTKLMTLPKSIALALYIEAPATHDECTYSWYFFIIKLSFLIEKFFY
jgi:hypothetical protein